MNHVLIDCERTKYPNTGLYHFCLQLGRELIKQADPGKEQLSFYVPKSQQLFGQDQQYVFQHPLHKFFTPGTRMHSEPPELGFMNLINDVRH